MIANLTTATPAEIDTELNELWIEEQRLEQRRELIASTLKHMAGFKTVQTRSGSYFRETWEQAVEATRPMIAEYEGQHEYTLIGSWNLGQLRRAFEGVTELTEQLKANADAQAPYIAEYTRRGGWTRFFVAQTNDGHVHSSMRCSSCNKGRSLTRFGWVIDFSGEDEAGIVEKAGVNACTVCFPTAPCVGDVDPAFRTEKEKARIEREQEKARKQAEKDRKQAEKAAKLAKA